MRPLLHVGIACLLFALTACTTPVYDLRSDPGFTYAPLLAGGLAIGGVAAQLEPLSPAVATQEAQVLAQAVAAERPALRIVGSEAVGRALGVPRQTRLQDAFGGGPLPGDVFSQLAPLGALARYVVYARLERDEVFQRQGTRVLDLPDPVYEARDRDGHRIWVPLYDRVEVIDVFETVRRLVVYFEVLDLHDVRVVWSGRIEKSGSHSNDFSRGVGPAWSPGFPGVGVFPPPPQAAGLLEAAYRGFAENLPKVP